MTERTDSVRATLAELHRELDTAGTLDSESRTLLQGALKDLLDTLADPPSGDAVAAHPPSLVERLRDAARRAEAEHPQLATVVERLMDTLASMGI